MLSVTHKSSGGGAIPRMSNPDGETMYIVYPNPANNVVHIEWKDNKSKLLKDISVTGELFDLMGQSKSIVQIIDQKATFSVKGLNKGIYVLKIYINGRIESHLIAVE